MKEFERLDREFRAAFKAAEKRGRVRFTIEGIKDDPDSTYPYVEVTWKNVFCFFYREEKWTRVGERSFLVETTPSREEYLTDKPLKAVIW